MNPQTQNIPDKASWPNKPVYVRPSPSMRNQAATMSHTYTDTGDGPSEHGTGENHVDPPIDIHKNEGRNEYFFFSKYFVGKASLLIKGVENYPESYFKGKQRKCRFVIQGQFLQSLPFASVYTGQAMSDPISLAPPEWVVKLFMPIVQSLQPAVCIKLSGTHPYVISPLMSTMQTVVVSEFGKEPDITDLEKDVSEDMSMVDPVFRGMKASKRKHYFADRANLEKYSFRTDCVYTFEFYQHILNLSTFALEYGLLSHDVTRYLGRRCIQVMAVVWTPPEFMPPATAAAQHLHSNQQQQHDHSPPSSAPRPSDNNTSAEGPDDNSSAQQSELPPPPSSAEAHSASSDPSSDPSSSSSSSSHQDAVSAPMSSAPSADTNVDVTSSCCCSSWRGGYGPAATAAGAEDSNDSSPQSKDEDSNPNSNNAASSGSGSDKENENNRSEKSSSKKRVCWEDLQTAEVSAADASVNDEKHDAGVEGAEAEEEEEPGDVESLRQSLSNLGFGHAVVDLIAKNVKGHPEEDETWINDGEWEFVYNFEIWHEKTLR